MAKKHSKQPKKTVPAPEVVVDLTPEPEQPTSTNAEDKLQWFWSHPWLPAIAVAAAGILAYFAGVTNGFVFFDDDKAILYNETLQNPSLSRFFSGQNLGMYAPFTWIAYWLGYLISEKEAWGYHLLGLLIHGINAALVFFAVRKITGHGWLPVFTALLFAVHPVQAEAVSWAAALSTVLFSGFYLASLLVYLNWRDHPVSKPFLLLLSVLLFAMSSLSKSAAVTLPLLLIALDYFKQEKLIGKLWLSKIPYFLISFAAGYYTFVTRAAEGHDIEAASATFTIFDRFLMVCQTILFYPIKLLVPFGFSIAYPFVKISGSWDWMYYAAPIILIGLAGLVLWRFRRDREVLLGLALYLLPLAVMLPFRTVGSFELRSDRYVYLSSIGIFLLIGLLIERAQPAMRAGATAVLGVLLGFLAWQQTQVWQNGISLFENCVDKTPESSLCQCNLAYSELLKLDFQGAIEHYSQALRYDSNTIEAFNGRGQAYMQVKMIPEALSDFNNAIRSGLSTPKLFLNRGKCLVMLNRPSEAIPDLSKSLELEPNAAEAWFFRASAKEKTSDVAGAASDYTEALKRKPDYIEALVNRGLLHMRAGKLSEAIADYSQAIQVNPNIPMVWNNRAYAYLQKGNIALALNDANQALTVDPNYLRAYQTRAAIYQAMGNQAQAMADLQKAQQAPTSKK